MYGGPDGEIGAAMRYLSQRYTMPFKQGKGLLTDIGTEVSKWRFAFSGKMDKRVCVAEQAIGDGLTGTDFPEMGQVFEVRILVGLSIVWALCFHNTIEKMN